MSNLFSLQYQDAVKGFAMAIISAILVTIQQVYSTGGSIHDINWTTVLNIAISTGIAYIVKNFLSDSNGAVLGYAGGYVAPVMGTPTKP